MTHPAQTGIGRPPRTRKVLAVLLTKALLVGCIQPAEETSQLIVCPRYIVIEERTVYGDIPIEALKSLQGRSVQLFLDPKVTNERSSVIFDALATLRLRSLAVSTDFGHCHNSSSKITSTRVLLNSVSRI